MSAETVRRVLSSKIAHIAMKQKAGGRPSPGEREYGVRLGPCATPESASVWPLNALKPLPGREGLLGRAISDL